MPLHIAENNICANCASALQGQYCHNCGEKKLDKKQLSLRHFFAKVWNALTFSDVKFLLTIKHLLFAPGLLTVEFFSGRQKAYTKPLALFFAINLLYFVYQPIDALNSTLDSQTDGQFYSSWANSVVEDRIAEDQTSFSAFSKLYNDTSEDVSKLFLFAMVLIFASAVSLINFRRKHFFYIHLITAAHYISFTILCFLIILPFIGKSIYKLLLMFNGNGVLNFNPNATHFTILIIGILLVYAFAMQARIYGQSFYKNATKSVLLVLAFILTVFIYRLILFLITMAIV